ncbi:MAG: 3-dehydroquinate synthase [Candidatus Brocadia sp.]|jgi:3-dehydroquinate synthase|uniref:3-dehydroquinate synthase n=1 Tax=Candidatus Brocadia fulgida TaxID=380242 RepID=A0A0M2V059_9BACT|nr:MAG: 3-dehydroquinate synthase [Candidatus Brocadia fulgida]MCC6326579.1 3-dehydroquinate synthase [Candidatus Brocadia sp.]MCE7911961.1 3-dehydroquinate synthase [Candidatus Brocadia sp. AMX3]OQZ00720.1 MAG: 3-dehydroquinate synthase [Candidatus Brocadia sp. UTAMX2]MBV6519373.1 3-dehydroquinate synthase [Candidatus Brocadia fulgida]
MKTIRVHLSSQSYNILIDKGLLRHIGDILAQEKSPCKTLLITDTNVERVYGGAVSESLSRNKFDVRRIALKPGEEQKTLDTALMLYDACFDHKLDRNSLIVAVGGGVVGDISGFVAATFMRGVPFIQVPTSLLAQVDSSIGGKVAVNHPKGKNMIGSFYQPRAVFIDTDTLSTLPAVEMVTGLAEVIKYGVIRDAELFAFLENTLYDILQLNHTALVNIIATSCKIKAKVVEEDEKETHLRAILNYGHTIGHAIEALTGYKKYRHGEAVAIGMLYATKIAMEMGLTDSLVLERQLSLIRRLGLPLHTGLPPEDMVRALYTDKKTVAGRLRFILPLKIGEVAISDQVTEEIIYRVLNKPL